MSERNECPKCGEGAAGGVGSGMAERLGRAEDAVEVWEVWPRSCCCSCITAEGSANVRGSLAGGKAAEVASADSQVLTTQIGFVAAAVTTPR